MASPYSQELKPAEPTPAHPVQSEVVEEVDDCESEDESDDSIRQTSRDLESGGTTAANTPYETASHASSSSGFSDPKKHNEKTTVRVRQLVPDIDPLEYHGLDSSPLPPKKGNRLYRYLRWNFGSVYRRIFCLAFMGNAAAVMWFIIRSGIENRPILTYQQAATAVTANILMAIVVRNEHIVNAFFWIFGTWAKVLPLWARTLSAKIYSYGGLHSGGAVAATFWYAIYLVLLTMDYRSQEGPLDAIRGYIYLFSYAIIAMLIVMLIFAYPRIRVLMHNSFENTHRFMGWTVVGLFWAQIMLQTADASNNSSPHQSFGHLLVRNASWWMLLITTLLIAYPWSRMRLRNVEAEVLSSHCVKLNFDYREVYFGQAIRLTDAPLKETHAFGVIPHPLAVTPAEIDEKSVITGEPIQRLSHCGDKGFSVIVSHAGDWTRKIIDRPPKQIYTRGTPQFGVMRCAGLFSPVIVIGTGSGIAPCLSLFTQHPDHPVRIIWSTPNPLQTYGRALLDLVYKTDPAAVVIDTRKTGRPDLVKIAYRVWEQSQKGVFPDEVKPQARRPCEAAVIISNQKVTEKVVYGLESRGVPTYGALFDS
ncbi:hypothetical protein B0T20DRAFT_473834 [Sordaria brevicollis]|uniref:Uncharacterized protein n=1 Tax=Sordaria brevicollis TaxID=83679 RepID=A0AAE0U2P5_SORBR|nr:hypothetical protein B0T20DRAFT_473834 [Sordaria brevicollis]